MKPPPVVVSNRFRARYAGARDKLRPFKRVLSGIIIVDGTVELEMAAGWTVDGTRALIGVWGEADIQSQLDGVARNRRIYEKISAQLREMAYEKTWEQCRTKIKNMTNKYRKASCY